MLVMLGLVPQSDNSKRALRSIVQMEWSHIFSKIGRKSLSPNLRPDFLIQKP